ncbi:class I adenylate-forming enzyme family protein [Parasphingorhabdus pacifica]
MRIDLTDVDALGSNLTHRVCVADVLTRAAQQFPDRTALVDGVEEITYADLEGRVDALARGLLTLGIEHQEPVGIMSRNSWRFVTSFFACARTGLVALPVNLALTAENMTFVLDDSGTRILFVEADLLPMIESIAERLPRLEHVVLLGEERPATSVGHATVTRYEDVVSTDRSPFETHVDDRDVVHCLYTSGTTSLPKGVLTSHVAVVIAALSGSLQLGHSRGPEGSVQPVVLPLFHTTALDTLLLPTFVTGGTIVLHTGFDPDTVLDAIEHRRSTHILLLPAMWAQLLAHPDIRERDLSSMRLCMYAMAPMPPDRLELIGELFPQADVLLGSGQTEFTPPTVFQWPTHQSGKSNSWGSAVATTDVRIMGPDGALLPRGQQGEIVYRGPQCMAGYWNNPSANAAVYAHGWFHSGDVGYLDEEGVVWFTDRLKDIVKTGGENVSSIDVERVLLGNPVVLDCAVVGLPHAHWGEAVTAFVVPTSSGGAVESELIAHCREQLAGFKVPKRIVVVDDLPRTGTGKVQKHLIRSEHARLHS